MVPSNRVKPRGTACLYSNQKSNKSPNKKMVPASSFMVSNQATNFFSLGKLASGDGAPKCWSEAKYIFLFSDNFHETS